MNATHESGGVRHPDSALPAAEAGPDEGMTLIIIMAVIGLLMLVAYAFGTPPEKGAYVEYVRRTAALCPPIAPRMEQLLADGKVTRDEFEIVPTLHDQARAAPGGLDACRTH